MTTTINASTSSGLVNSADTSGILQLQTASTAALTLDTSQNATFAGKVTSAGALTLASNGSTTAVTIDTSQKVGIGTTSPTGILNVKGTGGDALPATSGSTQSAGLITRLQQGGGIGSVMDVGGNGGTGSWIQVTEASNLATNYNLLLNPNGGNLGVGTTSPNSSFKASIAGNGTATTRVNFGDVLGFVDGSTIIIGSDGTNPTSWVSNAGYRFGSSRQGCIVAINPSGYTYEGGSGTGTRTFAVNSNGNVQNTNNSYGSLSDAKLKENITDATPKLESLMRVKIRNFNLIADEAKTKQIGVVAQELEEIFPSMIDEHIDYTFETYVREDGVADSKGIPTGTVTKEVKYSVFVPMLIKAIQELKAINDTQAETLTQQTEAINALTARIVALESK